MADIVVAIAVPDRDTGVQLKEKYKDMGDGTHARVVSNAGGGGGGGLSEEDLPPALAALGVPQEITVTMEPQDQVYLDTVPLQILPSPGAGKFIRVLDAMAWQVPGFSVYGCSGASVDMFLGDDKDTGIMVFNHTGCFDPDNLGNDTDDYVYKAYFGTGADGLQNGALLSAVVDKPLILQADGASNIAIDIATYEVANGGADYVNGDTGSFLSGDKWYDYIVTSSAAGVVSAISITEQGDFGTAAVASNVETSTGGGQPGVGAGLTINVLTVTAPAFDTQIKYSVVYIIQSAS